MAKKAEKAPQEKEAPSFERLIEVGIALSAEQDTDRLMKTILLEAKSPSNADGGTLYLSDENDNLKFEIMRTDSLNIAMGGTTGKEITFPPVRVRDPETGEENRGNVASCAALTGNSINIQDAYESDEYDFTGTKKFDEGTGYRSKSFLTVPMKNSKEEIIGVLQLLNAQDPDTGFVIPFSGDIQPLIEALASQAAVALDNKQLLDAQKLLLDSFIKLIASAIDAKSPYTGGHHEKMDGTGYPKRLNENDMSVAAKIMAIADIFEALTAADRPYKLPKKLSDGVKIMSFMKKDAHIDAGLFELFLTSGIYKEYAEKFLRPEQIDDVDITEYIKADD